MLLFGWILATSAPPTAFAKPAPSKGHGKPPANQPPGAQAPVDFGQPPSCAPGELTVRLSETESDIKCDEGWTNCTGALNLVARNCTAEFQTFVRIAVYEGERRLQVLEFSPAAIASPGGIWRESIPWNTPGELSAEVFYNPPGQNGSEHEHSVRAPIKIGNKALAAAKAACVQCSGVWGRYGMNKVEGCNCKTSDAGKTCYDGDECQGYCLFQRYDSEAHEEGICSETQHLVGCYGIIFKGASKFQPSRPPPRKRTTCVD